MPDFNYVASPEYDEHIKKQNLQDDGSGLGVPAFDPLTNRYPALKEQIGQWRGQGMSDADIDNGLAEQERELRLSGTKTPADLDALFGRTEYTRGLDKTWLLHNRIGAIAQITGEPEDDVKARTIDAFKLGIPASTAIEHPEIHKRLVGEYGTRLESNPITAFWDAAVGEARNSEQAALLGGYIKKLTAGPLMPEDQQRLVDDVRSYRERLAIQQSVEPDGFLAYIAKNAGELVGQQIPGISAGLKKYGLPMVAAGAATALAVPTGGLSLAGAGAALTPTFVGAAATAAGTAGAYEDMMNREALETFLELMQDPKNQTPEGQVQSARIAMAKGMINAYIELGTLGNIGRMLNIPGMKTIGLLPEKIKSAFTRFLGSPAALGSPTAANFLKRYAGTYLRNVAAESFEEAQQAFVGDAFLNFARSLNGDQSLGEAMGSLFSADELRSLGLVYGQSAASFASGMLPGGLIRAGAGLTGLRAYNKTPQGKLHKALAERQNLQGEGDVVFLPREVLQTFSQSAVPAGEETPKTPNIEETLGVTDADFVESTGEVMIPREKYEEAIRGNPALKAATEVHARYGAEGRTVAETAAAIRDNASDPINADTPFAKSARDVRDRKIHALKDAGYDDETAEAGGYVWAKYALRRAYALGENELGILRPDALTPAELDRLEIEGEQAAENAGGDTYGQAANDKPLYERRLDQDEKKWFQFVDSLARTDSGIQTRMMGTPLVFTLVTTRDGNSVSRYPLFVGAGKLQKIQRDHPYMTGDVLKQIPRALADPIAIFRSSEKSKNPNGLVAMLELRVPVNEQGQEDTVIAALKLNTKKRDADVDINVLTTVYSKANERANPIKPNPIWYQLQENLGNLVYVNTKKSSAWSRVTGVQFPSGTTVRNLASNSIKTEADLVKLRKENGDKFYQSAWHGSPHQFERFDLGAIGSGEGAQVHGWGLYFAQDRKISEGYRRKLSTQDNAGSLFEVDVPENDVLLDEQKDFTEQLDKVREAIKNLVRGLTDKQIENAGQYVPETSRADVEESILETFAYANGRQVYELLTMLLGSGREASETLNKYGVKGITYEGNRDGRCFVVFSDKAISVINRFNQRENAIRRGQIRIGSHGEGLVTLFKNADRSTFFHEMGHMMLDDLIADGLLEKANARTKADLETVKRYLHIEGMDLSKRHTFTGKKKERYAEAQERFARSFEAYLMEGKSPTAEMRGVFARVRQWLIDIYHDLSRLDVELSPEVREVFDRLLATPDEIDAARKTVGELALEESLLKQRLEELEGMEDLLPDEEYEKGYRKGFRKGVAAGRKREIEARRVKVQALKAAQAKRRAERKEINDAVKYMKRAVGMKSLSWRMQQAIREKLEQYTLKRPNKKRLEAARELLEYIEQTPDAEREQFNPADLRYIRMLETTTLGDMTLADVRALRQEIEDMVNRGREEFDRWEAERNSRREKWFAALNGDLAKTKRAKDAGGIVTNSADIGKQYDGVGGKAAKVKDWAYANTLGANRFFDWLGGGDGDYESAWTRLFVDEVNAAFDEELRHVQERHLAMEEKMKDLGITAADLNKKVHIRGEAYSKDMLLHVYAGLQNENSRAAILYGNMRATWLKEGEEGVQRLAAECVGALSENEKKLAHAVMRDFDENFGRVNDACIDAYNMGMEQEKNYTPMSRLEFAGQSLNNLFDIDEAAMMKGQQQTAGAARAHLEKGFMQNRIKDLAPENQKAIELGLMSVWHDQVETQEHTAAYAKLAGDLHSVLMKRDKATGRTLGAEVNDRFGHAAVANLREYTNIAVQGQNVTANAVMNGVSSYFGRNMAVAYLCLNLGTVLKQLTSIPRFLISANYGHLMTSIARFAAHPRAMLEKVYALDPQMRNRAPDAFMNVLRGAKAKETNAVKLKYLNALETMMKPISFADRLVSSIGWWATYQSNLKNGLSKEAAVREAQRAVALTQQTPLAKDMPRLWNQQGVARLMMIFTSDMANTWGMTVYDLTHTKDGKKVLSTVTALAMTAALMGFAEGAPDDDDDWILWMMHRFADQQISAAPLVGKEIMSALNVFMGDGYNQATYSSLAAPFVKLMQGVGGMAAADSDKVYGDGSTKFERSTFKALEGMSLLTPFPFTAANRVRRIVRADDAGEAVRILFGMRIRKK